MTVLDTDAAPAALSEDETHEILIAAARHCVADTERDLVLADSRGQHTSALNLTGQLAIFTRLERALDLNAPARPRRAA